MFDFLMTLRAKDHTHVFTTRDATLLGVRSVLGSHLHFVFVVLVVRTRLMTVTLCCSSLNGWFRESLLSLRIHAVHLFLRLERPLLSLGEAVFCGIASIVLFVVVRYECKTTCSVGLLAPPSCGLALLVVSLVSACGVCACSSVLCVSTLKHPQAKP